MRKVTVSKMHERYAQTVLTFRITYVLLFLFLCELESLSTYQLMDVATYFTSFHFVIDSLQAVLHTQCSGIMRPRIYFFIPGSSGSLNIITKTKINYPCSHLSTTSLKRTEDWTHCSVDS